MHFINQGFNVVDRYLSLFGKLFKVGKGVLYLVYNGRLPVDIGPDLFNIGNSIFNTRQEAEAALGSIQGRG